MHPQVAHDAAIAEHIPVGEDNMNQEHAAISPRVYSLQVSYGLTSMIVVLNVSTTGEKRVDYTVSL